MENFLYNVFMALAGLCKTITNLVANGADNLPVLALVGGAGLITLIVIKFFL